MAKENRKLKNTQRKFIGAIKRLTDENEYLADEIIKNTYRTLMTRGMKGCYIYCTDAGMKEYLTNRLEHIKVETRDNRQN